MWNVRAFGLAILLLPSPLWASTITFSTSDSQFSPGSDNQGWWSGTLPASGTANDNYAVGQLGGALLRDFFTFDLSSLNLAGQKVTGATLELTRFTYVGTDASETIEFFDVSTSAATLNNNFGTNAAIFNDLGTGTSYGSFVVPSYSPSTTLTVTFGLNGGALANITSAAGGFFSIGGSLQTIGAGGDQGLFGFSASTFGAGTQQLRIETVPTVPEPTSMLLLGSGIVTLAVGRYRRRRG